MLYFHLWSLNTFILILTDWHLYNDKRGRKRLDTRWRDEIEKFAGIAWQRIAQDRQLCKELGKAFVQQ